LARQRSGPDAQSALDRAERESERLNEMIGRLLTIARLETGDEAMQKFPVDVGELIEEIVRDADFEAQARNCHVDASGTEECWVMGDPSLLHSAIENVVRNATRYTREGTVVEVRLTQEPGLNRPEAVVQIRDSGPGVPEDSLDRMFRPFYRIDDDRGRRTGGVGLGLAITQRSVQLHKGSVRAFNRSEGGLLVEIRLPLATSEPGKVDLPEVVPVAGNPV
jgi:two-component system sensor histidine kinase CpxA